MAETIETCVDTLMETLASQLHSLRAILIGVLAIQAAQLVALIALALKR